MKKLKYSIDIHAPKEEVWKTLWDDATYRQWTRPFNEGSHAVSDWNEGSEVKFLGPDGEGILSTISRKIPNEQMSFRHIGMINNGQTAPIAESAKEWEGAMEQYFLSQNDDVTTLRVEVDVTEEHASHFDESFPRGLQIIKNISERAYEQTLTH